MQDVRDGIISGSVGAISKLKRVQSIRDGGAGEVLTSPSKTFMTIDVRATGR